jgi:hypothetical protein
MFVGKYITALAEVGNDCQHCEQAPKRIFGSDQGNSLISLINYPESACYLALNRYF